AGEEPAAAVAAAVAGGVDWVQVRERAPPGCEWLDFARAIAEAARAAAPGRVRVLVNRRLDVAQAVAADGAHLGFDAVGVADARCLLGADATIGVSCHSAEEAREAAAAGASYVHLAPIFEPLSKAASRAPLGLEGLAAAARCGVPVLAQGGLTAERAGASLRAGAAGIAVTGAILGTPDPGARAAELRRALDGT
ncbi:MAG: thiamine phosphate synthase, partial [Proteobacteria bacterium]|nr:thiamine phosphate synthase [Pseudomonadota bacterium]